MPWSPQVRPWDTELFEWGAQPLQQGCERVWRSCGLGLVFLDCFPKAMAMQQGCPSLCPFLPVVAASCQPNKKDTPPPPRALRSGSAHPKGRLQPKALVLNTAWRPSQCHRCWEGPRFHTTSSPMEMARKSWGDAGLTSLLNIAQDGPSTSLCI